MYALILLCALILSETLAFYKSFTYLLTYLLSYLRVHYVDCNCKSYSTAGVGWRVRNTSLYHARECGIVGGPGPDYPICQVCHGMGPTAPRGPPWRQELCVIPVLVW